MRVRPAGPDDLPALARLNAEVQALHVAARPERYRIAALDEIEDWMRRTLADPAVAVLLAVDPAGEPAGFCVVRRVDSPASTFALPRLAALVEAIGVAGGSRRRGAGRALMAAAEEQARAWGAAAVTLDVQAFNHEAERFYRALGYQTATLRMSKRL